jgi:hypothetical protein
MVPSIFPSPQPYAYTLLMFYNIDGFLHSMPLLSSSAFNIPLVTLSIPPSSFSTPYFL